MKLSQQETKLLDQLYDGRFPFHGELHDHASTGGTSDGGCTLEVWIQEMAERHLDFAAILDHRQVRHMYLPEWKDTIFIGGTEPAAAMTDVPVKENVIHYNMIFPGPKPLEELLSRFPEFEFTGGPEGHFIYPGFSRERFCELIDTVKELGGHFVLPHPKQAMLSDNPEDYWYRDQTGIEVFYVSADSEYTKENYILWTTLLAMGKHVWASAGGDEHGHPHDKAITTIYAEEKRNPAYIRRLREGDYTCGGVGIKMCIGETRMGSCCDFTGKRLLCRVTDFHPAYYDESHSYRVDLLDDKGVVYSEKMNCSSPLDFAWDTENCKFYRVEVFDETLNLRIAIGNPIWNI